MKGTRRASAIEDLFMKTGTVFLLLFQSHSTRLSDHVFLLLNSIFFIDSVSNCFDGHDFYF